MRNRFALTTAILATRAAAHGYIKTFTLDGKAYEGYERWAETRDPNRIGWSYTTEDEGPELDLASPSFACRSNAKVAPGYGTISAGGDIDIHWTSADKVRNPDGFPVGHHGPIMLYIAPCNGECASVNQAQLKWTKIAEAGLISGPPNAQGLWAEDQMLKDQGHLKYKLPASIKAGNYVLRSEIIALHKAHEKIPEFYMQCGNIKVTGAGTDDLSGSGVVSSQLYSTSDPIFGFDLHNNGNGKWVQPGPKLYAGAGAGAGPVVGGGSPPTSTTASSSALAVKAKPTGTAQPVVEEEEERPANPEKQRPENPEKNKRPGVKACAFRA